MPQLRVLFFASGCAALIYEMVWFYLVQLVVGASSISVAVLLCSFMGGMALGSWLLPKLAPATLHPLRLLAMLEAGMALLGMAIPFALPSIQQTYAAAAGYGPGSLLLRAVVCMTAYRKLTGLYTMTVLVASVNQPTQGILGRLDVQGMAFDNAMKLASQYLKAFRWEAAP